MKLYSTRDNTHAVDAAQAVVAGIAPDGGLYLPHDFPALTQAELAEYCEYDYPQIAAAVLHKFIDELSEDELLDITDEAYSSFDCDEVAPLYKLTPHEHILELWHGPTIAFKDMALQVLPRLLAACKKKLKDDTRTHILVATSGDTGKAALAGFADVPGTSITVFYPDEGVSDMQKLQMVTQEGGNVSVAAVAGNFDDAQTGVKKIFADAGFAAELAKRGIKLSSANSINFGRLAPQIAYYVYSYVELIRRGEIQPSDPVNFCVPTGNFGNILAAYFAMRCGLPVNKLICASNVNNVLTDFFHTGDYDAQRGFKKTMSPSMDILISSNLERLLWYGCGGSDERVRELMGKLTADGKYTVDEDMFERLAGVFAAGYADEQRTAGAIERTFDKHGYLIDPHTAVAQSVYEDYVQQTHDGTPTVLVSTASPYKFCADVLDSLGQDAPDDPFMAAAMLFALTGMRIPRCISELSEKTILHKTVCRKGDMETVLRGFLKG